MSQRLSSAGSTATKGSSARSQSSSEAALLNELASLKPSELRKRAKIAGLSAEDMDDAADSGDEVAALSELILQVTAARLRSEARTAEAALRKELAGLKMSALRKRAKQSGVGEDQMDDAADSGNEAAALVNLIVLEAFPDRDDAAASFPLSAASSI